MSIHKAHRNIFFKEGFEVVPKWKQCGKYNPDWSEDNKYLWNSGEYDHHMELVGPNDPDTSYFEKLWYAWDNGVAGLIRKVDDDKYISEMRENGIEWSSPIYNNLHGALAYISACRRAKKKWEEENE